MPMSKFRLTIVSTPKRSLCLSIINSTIFKVQSFRRKFISIRKIMYNLFLSLGYYCGAFAILF